MITVNLVYEVRQTIFALYVDTSYEDELEISTVFYIYSIIFIYLN